MCVFFGCSIVIMHIIFSSRRQNIKKHQQRPWRRQHRTMSSLLFYASILQIFAHGLNAQLLSEKIPLGKSFRHSYHIALPFLLFGYSVFIVGTYIRIIKKDFLSPLLRCSLFFLFRCCSFLLYLYQLWLFFFYCRLFHTMSFRNDIFSLIVFYCVKHLYLSRFYTI